MLDFRNITGRLLIAFLIAIPVLSLSSRGRSRTVSGTSQTGENIFRAKCAVCHGVDGSGQTENGKKLKVPDLRSEKVQSLTDDELLETFMEGKGNMPPIGKKYRADQLKQVVIHVRSLARKN